ncbi:GNAT family N-acetyltransferase [Halobacillus rhizosphaerae]|uniref:GNAT family N-acetyltransferase n=1 Tax=Halobacillus rhizosphaerae TaxID=3064889 RepID=UPI00398B53FC
MSVRFYLPGDEGKIRKLFKEVFRKNFSAEHWNWKYQSAPNRFNPFCVIYEDQGEILGHAALWVVDAYINGVSSKIGFRVDTMVSPKARGKGVYKQLITKMMEKAQEEGIEYLYGFPASGAKAGLIKHTNAQELGDALKFRLILRPFSLLSCFHPKLSHVSRLHNIGNKLGRIRKNADEPAPFTVEEVERCDSRFDKLSEHNRKLSHVVVKRDSNYLNWRYVNHPERTYRIIALSDGECLKGYVIIRKAVVPYKEGTVNMGFILDWLAVKENIYPHLFKTAVEFLSDCDIIQTWGNLTNQVSIAALHSTGFKAGKEAATLVIQNPLLTSKFHRKKDWWITLGDTDTF